MVLHPQSVGLELGKSVSVVVVLFLKRRLTYKLVLPTQIIYNQSVEGKVSLGQ